ncbi:hypothetical protein PM082_024673 [Marasmius tenuissimus]|nr:hypothetical protein PM082_024673 [Marasmius tenuissimus]
MNRPTYEPLAQDEGLVPEEAKQQYSQISHRRLKRSSVKNAMFVVSGAFNVIFFLFLVAQWFGGGDEKDHQSGQGERLLYSPVNHLIEHEVVTFHSGINGDTTKYMGPPSPEVDAAWDELYGFGMSKISKHEADQLPLRTVRISGDRDRYAVQLDVFHQLHCLNMIRKALYPDYYHGLYPPGHNNTHEDDMNHVAHCVEHIRQGITCASDVSLIVWEWVPEKNTTMGRSGTPHTCRKFDKIAEWAKQPEHLLRPGEFDPRVHVTDEE